MDRAGALGGWPRKLRVCLYSGLLILPASLLMDSPIFAFVLAGVPLYFALSGIVTAVGFSAILDVVPNRLRGLAMSMSFFLNVALGAGARPNRGGCCRRPCIRCEGGAGATDHFDRRGGLSHCPCRTLRVAVHFGVKMMWGQNLRGLVPVMLSSYHLKGNDVDQSSIRAGWPPGSSPSANLGRNIPRGGGSSRYHAGTVRR